MPQPDFYTLSDLEIRSILERGPAVVYHCARSWDQGLDYISANISSLLGWADEDFLSDPAFRLSIIHPEDLGGVLRSLPAVVEKGAFKQQYRIKHRDGGYVWVLDDMRILANEHGEGSGVIGYLTDITELKEAEYQSRQNELRHHAIFQTVLEGIITIDSKGVMIDFNPAAEKIFGYPSEKVIGKNVSMLMPEPHSSRHDDYLQNYIDTAKAQVIGIGRTVKGKRADGSLFEMNLSVSELNLPEGLFFVGAVRDISQQVCAQKALQVSQERLKMSQRFAKMGNWDWHIVEDRLFWSEEMFDLYGYDNDGVEEREERFQDWVLEEDLPILKSALRKCLRDGVDFKCEYRVKTPSGEVRWIRESGDVVRLETGQAVRMLGITQDISAEKRHEDELQTAREAADQANSAKSEFLSRMSHELRTPLNAILGFAQLLSLSNKHPLSERQQRQVGQIASAGGHLMELINEVLDLSRIEAGRLDLAIERVDVKRVCQECLELSENAAQENDIKLETAQLTEIEIMTDRTRLKQVLVNLISNAVKYNHPGGFVRLEIHDVGNEEIEIQVIDNGIGIAPEKQSDIFKPFDRLGAEALGVEGTGIGLTLTKQLVEAMGGRIGLDSVVEEGTTFWVRLPKQAKDNAQVDDKRIKMLLIEQNAESFELMQQLSSMIEAMEVVCVDNAEDGLREVAAGSPDIVLLDSTVVDDEGKALISRLRERDNLTKSKVIRLVDRVKVENDEAVALRGFDAELTLPLSVKRLRGIIESVRGEKYERNQ